MRLRNIQTFSLSKVLHEKLTKKLSAFNGTQRFITTILPACH
jgi:hypothetical protein